MPAASERPVTTWADGYGVWHASVPLVGDERIEAETARVAIWAELSARDVDRKYARVLAVVREGTTSHGTVKYREV